MEQAKPPVSESVDSTLLDVDFERSNEGPKTVDRTACKLWVLLGAFLVTILAFAIGVGIGFQQNRSHKESMDRAPATLSPTASPQMAMSPTILYDPSSMPVPLSLPRPQSTMRPSVSFTPTVTPSGYPSHSPSQQMSRVPTRFPSTVPTQLPSNAPTNDPSSHPTKHPTLPPTMRPTAVVEKQITTFYAIGDVPYTDHQAVELVDQMLELPDDAEFVIHVGDLLNSKQGDPCPEEAYIKASNILRNSHAPVFVLIGDNDWNDCPNMDEALSFWKKHFLNFDTRYWNHTFQVQHLPDRSENFSFLHKGTLFIGLNLVGGEVQSEFEWTIRLTDEIDWTLTLIRSYVRSRYPQIGRVVLFGQADPRSDHGIFFDTLRSFIIGELNNETPILYINGDQHYWLYEPNFYGQSSFLRVMVHGQTVDPPLKVMVYATGNPLSPKQAFQFDRRLK